MNKRKRAKKAALWTVALGVIAICMVKIILDGPLDTSCKMYRYTGFSCSGCGTTRMAESMFRGDFYQAFRFNPFIFLTLPIAAVFYVIIIVRYVKYNDTNDWMTRVLVIYAIALCAFGVIRNIPGLRWLLPTMV
ncbi:MAG: DUF2752 domain-containing protein [bacterium]|nr:DUF2752 domain-containing protein [bacterium]